MATLPQSLRLLFVACAGISSFYVAAHWAQAQRNQKAGVAEAVVKPAPRAAAAAASASSGVTEGAAASPDIYLPLAAGGRPRAIPRSESDAFARLSWLPPPPPPPPPTPPPPPAIPPPPVAPPLPFVFVGMLERGDAKAEAFLAKGEALFVVSAGDTLDNNTYRIDSLSANEVVVTYLPLNTQQTLNVSTGSK